jgi:hypothetical protein
MFNALLVTLAGAALLAPTIARRVAWRRANRPNATPQLAIGSASVVNVPYVARTHEDWTERDWRAVHTAQPRPEYEGLHPDDERDGDSWIAMLRASGHTVVAIDSAAMTDERANVLLGNAEFERFDRMCSRGMAHVDTICKATIERWMAEYDQWCDANPSEALAVAMHDTHEWIERERGAVTKEFERIMLAEALLVS